MEEDEYIEVFDELEEFDRAMLMNFPVNSSELTQQHKNFLTGSFARYLSTLPFSPKGYVIGVGGWASYTGTMAHNQTLSNQRASAVGHFIRRNIPAAGPMAIRTIGFGYENAKEDPRSRLPPAQREKAEWNWRTAMVIVFAEGQKIPPLPPREEFYYYLRVLNQLSLSVTEDGLGIGLDLAVHFEIKDKNNSAAKYRYTGAGPAAGLPIPIEKIGKLVGILRNVPRLAPLAGQLLREIPNGIGAVAKFMGDHAGDLSGVPLKGKWNYFTYRRGPFFERPVQQWAGAANLTGYFVPFVTSYTFINFGGREAFPELGAVRYRAHIDPFDGGDTIGLPQASSTNGDFVLLEGPYSVSD